MRSPAFLLATGLALVIAALSVWWYLQPELQPLAPGATPPGLPFQGPASAGAPHANTALQPASGTPSPATATAPAGADASTTPAAAEAEQAALFEPLPASADALDAWLQRQLSGPLANADFAGLITQANVIDRTVNVIVNLAKGQIARAHLPIAAAQGKFAVIDQGDESFVIAEQNAQRYARYVDAIEKFDTATLAAFYRVVSPALESAHRQLGEPGSFHNALKLAFDMMLATPDLDDAQLTLVRPKVMYQYAAPELEKLPPAQKLMLRIGQQNRSRVKAVIAQWRAQLTP